MTDYWVAIPANGGNDGNAGTLASPIATLAHANSLVAAGDRVLVTPGTYGGFVTAWGNLRLTKAGSSGSPIWWRSVVKWGAKIDASVDATNCPHAIYFDATATYNILDGFEMSGSPLTGIQVFSLGHNTIINCYLHDCGIQDNQSTVGQAGIYIDQTDSGANTIANNLIYNNGRWGDPTYYVYDHGIYTVTPVTQKIINNLFIHNASMGIQMAGGATSVNQLIYNNVCAYNGASGIVWWEAYGTGNIMKNNIFYNNVDSGIRTSAATGGPIINDHNCSFGNGLADNWTNNGSTVSHTDTGEVLIDPKFVNPAKYNFRLRPGSPMIRGGVIVPVANDFDGNIRPSAGPFDIGAYRFNFANKFGSRRLHHL